MRNKKFLLGAGIVVLVALLGLVITLFLVRGEDEVVEDDLFPTAGDTVGGDSDLDTDPTSQNNFWGEGGEDSNTPPILRTLSNEPVAGGVAFLLEEPGYQEGEYARYVERSTGHIFDTNLAFIEEPLLRSGETMLRIGRVFWSHDGNTTLLQRLDSTGTKVYSYLGTFSTQGTSTDVQGDVMFGGKHIEYDDVISATISPDARSIFYIVRTDTGSVGYLESVPLGTRTQMWSSPLTHLTAVWGGQDSVLVYTNPSSVALGFVWLLDVRKGTSKLVLSNEYALSARMDKTGAKILYSLQETSGGLTSLRILDVASGNVTLVPSGTASIVEKCVWDSVRLSIIYCAVPRNVSVKDYLENWQYGLLASDDVLWQINTSTGEVRLVMDPVEVTTDSFDIVDLSVSPFGNYLVFKTKQNDILWSAQIPAELLPGNDPTLAGSTTTPTL